MSRRQYQSMDNSSGVGVLDKAAIVLGALEAGPLTLAGLVQATGLARPTAQRLAVALEYHRLVARDLQAEEDAAAPRRELDRVRHQISQHLDDAVVVERGGVVPSAVIAVLVVRQIAARRPAGGARSTRPW